MNPTLRLNFFPQIQIGMNTRKQKRKQRGGQPLSYTNPNYSEPSALPGSPLLSSASTVARPEIAQKGGVQRMYTDIGSWIPWTEKGAALIIQPQAGGQNQPLSYTNTEYREVSALPGTPLLESYGTIARPEIAMKGGFSPSVMTNLVGNAAYLTPLAMSAAYRLWSNRQTRKQHGGTGEEWDMYRQQAKLLLQGVAPGKANAKWVNKVAKMLKEKKNTAAAIAEFRDQKGIEVKGQNPPRFATKLNEWEYNQRQAKKELVKYGEPTAVEVTHLAALRTGRKGKAGDADKYIEEFRQQYKAKKNAAAIAAAAEERQKEEKRIQRQIKEAEKAAKKPKVEKPKLVFDERPWANIRKEAKDELQAMKKKMHRGNVMRYASMKRLKNTDRMGKFMEEFRSRPAADPRKLAESNTNDPTSDSNEEFRVNRLIPLKKQRRKTMKKRNGREEWESYQSGARRMLERIGPATIAEVSALAKMMKEGENTRPFINEFEARVKQTEIRLDDLEKQREEPKPVIRVPEEPLPQPKPVIRVPEEPLPQPKPAIRVPEEPLPPRQPNPLVAAPIAAAQAVEKGQYALFRQRMAELAKKYPAPK